MRPMWRVIVRARRTATTPSAMRATPSTGTNSSSSHSIPKPPAACTMKRCPTRLQRGGFLLHVRPEILLHELFGQSGRVQQTGPRRREERLFGAGEQIGGD